MLKDANAAKSLDAPTANATKSVTEVTVMDTPAVCDEGKQYVVKS